MNKTELLAAICDGKPRVHATGFAQLYLRPDVRLHVWTEALLNVAPDIKQIVFKHDHRYGIISHVLRGVIHDQAATISEPYRGGQWEVWEVRPAGQGLPDKPQLFLEGYTIEEGVPRIVQAGETYKIMKRSFHSSRAVGTTVTVMRKTDEEEAWARLLVPRGFDPVHSLSSQPSLDFIRGQMLEACYDLTSGQINVALHQIGYFK